MALDPYSILGVAFNASKDQAKQAYRRLAGKLHPDHGGDEAKFKEIQRAWEAIEKGYTAPIKNTPKPGWSWKPKPVQPASGYEAKGPPQMPRTGSAGPGVERFGLPEVVLEITAKQAFEGCTVPFIHQNKILEHEIRAGLLEDRTSVELFPSHPMIGMSNHLIEIRVVVHIIDGRKTTDQEKKFAHKDIKMPVCALGLFTGGKIETRDHLNELIEISIPSGFNPTEPIIVQGKGLGPVGKRGDLRITIEPIFRRPNELNSNELRQLQRLNEMAKHE